MKRFIIKQRDNIENYIPVVAGACKVHKWTSYGEILREERT